MSLDRFQYGANFVGLLWFLLARGAFLLGSRRRFPVRIAKCQ